MSKDAPTKRNHDLAEEGNVVTSDDKKPDIHEGSKMDPKFHFLPCLSKAWASLIIDTAAQVSIVLLLWLVCFLWVEAEARPGGVVFAFAVLLVAAVVIGRLCQLVHVPPLLGMLVAGIFIRNVPGGFFDGVDLGAAALFRSAALTIILLRGGLGLDLGHIRRLGGPIIRLAFIPCLVEATTAALMALALFGMPPAWCFALGFMVAAVSPAVVVPSLLALQEKGYGVDKGIPSMVLAAAGLDDVVAITGFGVSIGLVFSQGSLIMNILHGPLELLAGFAGGGFLGVVFWFLELANASSRVTAIFCVGFACILGGKTVEFTGAGALATIVSAFVAAQRWDESTTKELAEALTAIWNYIAQPALFGLIGASLSFKNLEADVIGYGMILLAVSLTLRSLAVYLCVKSKRFLLREEVFLVAAWLPKATVQAALGPVAMDLVREKGAGVQEENYARTFLTLAVVVILVSAPIGAILIALLGPRLLTQTTSSDKEVGGNGTGGSSADDDEYSVDQERGGEVDDGSSDDES